MDIDLKKIFLRNNIDPALPLVVGVSGGADSIFLLHCLNKEKFNIIVGHFNHQLRCESDRDALFVQKISENYGNPFFLGKQNVKEYADHLGLSVEEAARICRYRFLFKVAEKNFAQAVVVAHHANDQVETLLMHFLRGSGLDGLKGIEEKIFLPTFHQSIPVLRPLLHIWRKDIQQYINNNNLTFVEDTSNSDARYFRNKLRLELLPQLERDFPGLSTRALQLTDLIKGDSELIEELMDQKWGELCLTANTNFVSFDLNQFHLEKIGTQRRLIRKSLIFLKPDLRDISFSIIKRALEAIIHEANGETELLGQLCVRVNKNIIYIYKNTCEWFFSLYPQVNPEANLIINNTGTYNLGNQWQISLEELDIIHLDELVSDDNTVLINKNTNTSFPWSIKNSHPGLRFSPFGMKSGRIKLSDFFINQKILEPARKNYPILFDKNNQVIWVPGLRLDEHFRINILEPNFYKLSLKKN